MLNALVHMLLVVLPFFVGLYSFWLFCKKDGFDQEKAFDLLIAGFLAGGVVALATYYVAHRQIPAEVANLDIFSFVFGFLGVSIIFINRWGWSVYRVLDNFALALTLSLGFWLVLQGLVGALKLAYLLAGLTLFVVYFALQKYRLVLLKSGFTFSLTSAIFCVASGISSPRLVSLIFIGLLFTLTLGVFIFRVRRIYVEHKKVDSASRAF